MKYVFVPIGVIGCGKSTIFLRLKQQFPDWAYVLSDLSGGKYQFLDSVASAINTHNVVLVDRNNHLANHRQELLKYKNEGVLFVCLDFAHYPNQHFWKVALPRVLERGDEHPTIKSATLPDEARKIMGFFLKSLQRLDRSRFPDKLFDFVLPMKVGKNSSPDNARKVADFMRARLS